MIQLEADQKLTLQAFQAAVDTYKQRGLDLPERISAIADTLENHIDELDALSEIDPTFEMIYEAVGSALYNSSQRAKLLNPPETAKTQNGNHTASNGNSAHTPHSTTNGHSAHNPTHTTNGHNQTGPPPVIKRFVLPLGFSPADRQQFDQYIQELRQLNPHWVIAPDHCRPGEADAYVMLYNDEHYTTNHTTYLVDQVLNQAFN
jgi:hypothetical protein